MSTSTPSTSKTVIVDDRDPRIIYTGGWQRFGAAEEFNITTSLPQASDSVATFNFNGTGVHLYGSTGSNNGTAELRFTLDGVPQDPFIPSSTTTNKIRLPMFVSDTLNDGPHQLVISRVGGGDPAMFLDYLLYNVTEGSDSYEHGGTTSVSYFYDDTSPFIQYDSNWEDAQDQEAAQKPTLSQPFQNTLKSVGSKGGSFKFDFHGSSVSIVVKLPVVDPDSTTTPSNTSASIRIDNTTFPSGANAPISLRPNPPEGPYSNTLFFSSKNSLPLQEGPHTMTVIVPEGNVFNLDYILVDSSSSPPSNSTANQSPPSGASLQRSNTAAVIGGVVGGIVFLILIMAFIFLFMRRRRKLLSADTYTGREDGRLRDERGPARRPTSIDPFNVELERQPIPPPPVLRIPPPEKAARYLQPQSSIPPTSAIPSSSSALPISEKSVYGGSGAELGTGSMTSISGYPEVPVMEVDYNRRDTLPPVYSVQWTPK